MSAELDALTAQVAATKSVEQSAVVLIQGIAAKIAAAAAAGADPAVLNKMAADLKASSTALADAVAANP